MLVLGAIVHEQEDGHRGQAVEDGLRLAVDPVEVLEDQDQRLHPALAEEKRLDGLEGPAAPVRRFQGAEGAVLRQGVEESEDARCEPPVQDARATTARRGARHGSPAQDL
jgi:hypothetical protein